MNKVDFIQLYKKSSFIRYLVKSNDKPYQYNINMNICKYKMTDFPQFLGTMKQYLDLNKQMDELGILDIQKSDILIEVAKMDYCNAISFEYMNKSMAQKILFYYWVIFGKPNPVVEVEYPVKVKEWAKDYDIKNPYDLIALHKNRAGWRILDFAFPEVKLGFECDGLGHKKEDDDIRDTELVKKGWYIKRFSNKRNKPEDVFTVYENPIGCVKAMNFYLDKRTSDFPKKSGIIA